jgi:FkbM family methyltransferase
MGMDKMSTADLSSLYSEIDKELKYRRRHARQSAERVVSPRELKTIEEYKRRIANGEAVDPLVETVDFETLVTSEVYERILDIDEGLAINGTVVRGIPLKFYTPNLRALWQSYGQEYIEPELLNFIDGLGGDSVYFDIGASTGVFAIYAAAKGVKTYCFEPEVANFNILNTNAFLNFENIGEFFHAFNIALSDKCGTSSLFVRKFEPSAHEKILGRPDARDGSKGFAYEYKQRVLCQTLDEFCYLEGVVPSDIKIDVDGHELAVIDGMQNTLKSKLLQRIFIEISEDEHASQQALARLIECGFSVLSKKRVQNYFVEFNYTLVRD